MYLQHKNLMQTILNFYFFFLQILTATKSLKENANLSQDEIVKLQQRWQQEREWMTQLQAPYIVRGLNDQVEPQFIAYLTERHAWRPLQPIVMEYCNGGDLRAQLQLVQNINGLAEFKVREILHALRHAIEFLHTKCRIEHRDLKPDNVVIHNAADGRRIYKLTDFGFARNITENTMLKSIVGTRNYVAPEVLDTAHYKNTVDYWSLGIIAFELMCGNLPFIPHQQLYDIVTNIRKKKEKCIAITEDINELKYVFHEKMPIENHMSKVFLTNIEDWLTIALDQNYHTRGTRLVPETKERVLIFYTDLDRILAQKVLTVFVLPTLKFYAWEITEQMTLSDFRELVKRDTGIEDMFCIFPTGHPRTVLSHTYRAIDFFVEEWQNNRDSDSPPAMLYIDDMKCREYQVTQPEIPVNLKKYLNARKEIPNWLLKTIEQSTHFMLGNEQLQLEAFVSGLKEYALTMEHEIFQFDAEDKGRPLQQYFTTLTDMHGRVEQFCMSVEAAQRACLTQIGNCDNFFNQWCAKAWKFKEDIATLNGLKTKVSRYYKSGLRRAKEMAVNPFFAQLKNKDAYKLLEFRRHLETVQKVRVTEKERLEACKTAVYACLGERENALKSPHLKFAYSDITSVNQEFLKLRNIVDNSLRQLEEMGNNLTQSTIVFHTKIIDIYKGGKEQSTKLAQDGVSTKFLNGNADVENSISELLHYPVTPLIEEVTGMIVQMDIEEDMNKNNDLPATINE
ncbi:PREDICTED: inhibitor of nuclear factor kappa-B kinase subunit beta-like [Rhagoletis zephyria]|uniref:inhibitor of nuclear factor kappa-B kinase subunit beta-like n=1 Tax=Rhagoletis zephyria TaxID=28612 RepID=UPI00081160E0|nr:PREDICTED: inhibitor of nuclear factor kappa-B kinase subunit beta-like [Rhagoletis zephyria]